MATAEQPSSVVQLTDSAVAEVKAMLEQDENRGKLLRVYVEKGGCSGMQYALVFDEERPGDLRSEFGSVAVVVDPFSANYLSGSTVDFMDSLTGGGFKISNPKARHSCGCGKSFEPQAG